MDKIYFYKKELNFFSCFVIYIHENKIFNQSVFYLDINNNYHKEYVYNKNDFIADLFQQDLEKIKDTLLNRFLKEGFQVFDHFKLK